MACDYADLHIHSIYSDSSLSVENVFEEAKNTNLKCISLTDHDTTAGTEEAEELSKSYGIEFIKGIEFSAEQDNREVHLLGYLIDNNSMVLKDAVCAVRKIRTERIVKMSLKLNLLGMKVDKDELSNTIGNAVPTRLHLALYMVKKGYVNSIRNAFKKYLSYGKPAYVAKFRYSVEKAIGIIKESRGIVLLAHPHLLSSGEWIDNFVKWGIDGMEVMYPGYSKDMTNKFSRIAEHYGILKGGGSDAHGVYKSFTSVGKVKIPYQWVEMIKERHHKLFSEIKG